VIGMEVIGFQAVVASLRNWRRDQNRLTGHLLG